MRRIAVNDTELNVLDAGQGHPILFAHGFPLDHAMWRGQLDEFAGTHRVVTPDLRGFGASRPAEGATTMEQFADDLNALLDALKIDEPVTLCGLSMGGYVALQFVRTYGERLRALILCDTRAGADSPEAVENRRKTARTVLEKGPEPIARTMIPRLVSEATLERRPEVAERLWQMIVSTNPSSIAAALEGMAVRPDSTDLLPQIAVPTLLVVGEEDQITPRDEMRQMAAAIPQARLVEIPQTGHMAPMEDPAAVNAAIREFLVSVDSD